MQKEKNEKCQSVKELEENNKRHCTYNGNNKRRNEKRNKRNI